MEGSQADTPIGDILTNGTEEGGGAMTKSKLVTFNIQAAAKLW